MKAYTPTAYTVTSSEAENILATPISTPLACLCLCLCRAPDGRTGSAALPGRRPASLASTRRYTGTPTTFYFAECGMYHTSHLFFFPIRLYE